MAWHGRRPAGLRATPSGLDALPGVTARVGAGVGVATGAPSGLDALLRDADADMYRVKTARKAAVRAAA